jgi:hypothetical protein
LARWLRLLAQETVQIIGTYCRPWRWLWLGYWRQWLRLAAVAQAVGTGDGADHRYILPALAVLRLAAVAKAVVLAAVAQAGVLAAVAQAGGGLK